MTTYSGGAWRGGKGLLSVKIWGVAGDERATDRRSRKEKSSARSWCEGILFYIEALFEFMEESVYHSSIKLRSQYLMTRRMSWDAWMILPRRRLAQAIFNYFCAYLWVHFVVLRSAS